MGSAMKRGNDTEPKVERKIDPRSETTMEKFRGEGQSRHHANLQERGNLDGAKSTEGRSEAGHGQSEHHQMMQKTGNLDGSRKEYDKKQK